MTTNNVVNYRYPELMATRKIASDLKNDTEELPFQDKKGSKVISRARFSYDDSMERKRLASELKEVWEH